MALGAHADLSAAPLGTGRLAALRVLPPLPTVERAPGAADPDERRLGAVLDALAVAGWRTIHERSRAAGHVAIGPGGMLLLHTDSRAGRVRTAGVRRRTLEETGSPARRLARFAGMWVDPVIVFTRAELDRPLLRRHGVLLVAARMLPAYLLGRIPALSEVEIAALHRRLAHAPSRRALG